VKIGAAIITCNRPTFLKKCFNSIPKNKLDELVIINDGEKIAENDYTSATCIDSNGVGVGKAKNIAFKYLLDKQCDVIFIIEDDMLIIRDDIFDAYIAAYKETGIHHFLFGYHGPANKNGISGGEPKPRRVIEYPSGLKIALNQHCVGAFCMYTRESLQDVGLFNNEFHNAFEHVHHSYLLCKKGYCVEYWWWPDIANSLEYIQEQACSEHNSSIRPRTDWQDNIKKGFEVFERIEGVNPVRVPDSSTADVIKKLKDIKLCKKLVY